MLPGQSCAPQRLQGPHMENEMLRGPYGIFDIDFLGGSSRKRKSTAMDQPGAKSDLNLEYPIPWESNVQKASLLSGTQVEEENPHGLCSNQTKSVEPTTVKFEKDQFHYQNRYSGSWMTSNGNFHANVNENQCNASSRLPPQSSDYKGSFESHNMQAGECNVGSNWQPQACNLLGPSEAYTSPPFSKTWNAQTGKGHISSHCEELMSFGTKNHVTDNMPLGMCNAPCKSLRSGEILQQNFLKSGGRTFSPDDKKSGISCELRQSSHSSNNGGINDVSTKGAAYSESSLCTEQNHRLLQNEVQFGGCESLGVCSGEISENEEQGHGDGDGFVKLKRKIEATDMKDLKNPLSEEFSVKNGSPNNIVEHGQKNDVTHVSLRSDEKSKSHFGKAVSVVAEEIWEGSLQLSSSVVVSAVAFFKSGEKLLETNWCESIEVKGKVRLEAFEKYIQDLPRSRNRGLMVISLCWKEGSSEIGFAGMKEVAKGYKKGKRVGFAQLSPGIDLYICPRSEAIITILAKYGFFKGMAAVEDNQDSMIGCIVWRRNRTSSNSVSKKSERSNSLSVQPVNSPSDSPIHQAAEKHLSVTQPAQESLAPASVSVTSTIEGAGKNGSESKNSNSSKMQIEISNSFPVANYLLTASVPSDSSIPAGLQISAGSNSNFLHAPQGDLSEVETHPTCCSGPELPKASLELQEPKIPFSSNILMAIMPTSDDDDLPEFDYTTACGISQTNMSKASATVMLDKKLLPEGIQKTERLVLSGMPNVQAMPASNQRSDHSMLPMLHLTANEGMPPLKIFCERESHIPVFPIMAERLCPQNKVTTTLVSAATVFASPKNLFDDDDDDDMPEWCPPDLKRQSLAGTSRPSTTIPSELPDSNFQNLACGPRWPVLPSPLSAATHPRFSSQAFLATFRCPTIRAPQPWALERGPSSSMGFSNSILGPPPSFDVKLPFHPPDKRGWRP